MCICYNARPQFNCHHVFIFKIVRVYINSYVKIYIYMYIYLIVTLNNFICTCHTNARANAHMPYKCKDIYYNCLNENIPNDSWDFILFFFSSTSLFCYLIYL